MIKIKQPFVFPRITDSNFLMFYGERDNRTGLVSLRFSEERPAPSCESSTKKPQLNEKNQVGWLATRFVRVEARAGLLLRFNCFPASAQIKRGLSRS